MKATCSCGRPRAHATDDFVRWLSLTPLNWSWRYAPSTWQLIFNGVCLQSDDDPVVHPDPAPAWVHDLCWSLTGNCLMPRIAQ